MIHTYASGKFSVRFALRQPHYADCGKMANDKTCLKLGKALQYGDDRDVDVADLCSVFSTYCESNIEACTSTRLCTFTCKIKLGTKCMRGPGMSVGIATGYGLDGPGIESRRGRDFPPLQIGPGSHPASSKMGTVSFPGGKLRPGACCWPLTPF